MTNDAATVENSCGKRRRRISGCAVRPRTARESDKKPANAPERRFVRRWRRSSAAELEAGGGKRQIEGRDRRKVKRGQGEHGTDIDRARSEIGRHQIRILVATPTGILVLGVGIRSANRCDVIVQTRCGRRDVLQITHRPGDRGESDQRDEQHGHDAAPNSVMRKKTRTFCEPHSSESIPEPETAALTFLNGSVRTVAVQAVCKSSRPPGSGQRPPQQVPSVETIGDARTGAPWSVTASSAMPQTWQWPGPFKRVDGCIEHVHCPAGPVDA